MNWREWLRKLAGEPYHILPEQAAELTVYQARMLCTSDEDASGKIQSKTEAAAKKRQADVQRQYDVAIRNLMQGRCWDETDV